jgi:hypothetical protein
MKQKSRVLWVEDEARGGLVQLSTPVFMAGYDLVVADDASACEDLILETEFAAVVIDIRIPPGNDPRWIAVFNENRLDRYAARLGCDLAATILASPEAKVPLKGPKPAWLSPERVGVLTVERTRDVQDLQSLGITVIREKQVDTPSTVLLDIVTELIAQTTNAKGDG